jgi:hypothetical protein
MRQAWADEVAAEIVQSGNILSGTLCAAGLPAGPSDTNALAFCGSIVGGYLDGRHVRFGATIEGMSVRVDADVSEDGARMGGRFWYGSANDWTSWWPIGGDSAWINPDENWPPDLRPWSCGDQPPGYTLTLVDAPAGALDFARDRTYLMVFCGGIAGELGAFGGPDLTVTSENGHTIMIVAGPVPETTPTRPTGLTLRFENSVLVSVEARMPSGATYSFRATRSPGGTL